jgi:alkanesulfonate monooxygenase SsuD/methylene tetrahydromethanopterin reductase-like flavin-dependent oxidoreductase (luciferase family)
LGELFEHHYSARILSQSPIVMAAHMAAHLKKIKIAVLGPIIPLSNPVRVAEELAMLDNLTQGRLVVGLLRGMTNEYLVYSIKPEETRERRGSPGGPAIAAIACGGAFPHATRRP